VVYRASQPEQKIIRTRLRDLARSVQAENVTRQAVVIVGRVLDTEGAETRSKLYDKDFTHGYRR
jgi:precorrin-4/cobalt-precorrin-4 C11-methyltransferase